MHIRGIAIGEKVLTIKNLMSSLTLGYSGWRKVVGKKVDSKNASGTQALWEKEENVSSWKDRENVAWFYTKTLNLKTHSSLGCTPRCTLEKMTVPLLHERTHGSLISKDNARWIMTKKGVPFGTNGESDPL